MGQLGVEFNKEKHQKCNYSKVHWGITTKFLPLKDLKRSQLSTKFEECSLKNDAATPLTISNFSRAWQAYFLSYTLQIWCENTSFKDVQMMFLWVLDISTGFRFGNFCWSCHIQFLSHPCIHTSVSTSSIAITSNRNFLQVSELCITPVQTGI